MGKAGFLSFFVVLTEISNRVKEFFRNDGGHDLHEVPAKEDVFARASAVAGPSFKAYSKETAVYLHLIRTAGAAFLERNHQWISWKHVKVPLAVAPCRTAALSGHLD
jgi:hypothetical protein